MAGISEPQRSRSAVPLSIEQLVARAQSFDYNPNIALRHWLRSAATLLKEVMKWNAQNCFSKWTDMRSSRPLSTNVRGMINKHTFYSFGTRSLYSEISLLTHKLRCLSLGKHLL